MPDSVAAANPTTVLPWALARSFQEKRTIAIDQNRYPDGSQQSRVIVSSSRREFSIVQRLNATDLDALRQFFIDRNFTDEFYFYNVYETSPIFSYDDTGTATTGRYIVRLSGPFQYSLDWGRNPAQFALRQVS